MAKSIRELWKDLRLTIQRSPLFPPKKTPTDPDETMQAMSDEFHSLFTKMYMQYLGTLGKLAEISVYIPKHSADGMQGEDLREDIIRAIEEAKALGIPIEWRRIINRIELEIVTK